MRVRLILGGEGIPGRLVEAELSDALEKRRRGRTASRVGAGVVPDVRWAGQGPRHGRRGTVAGPGSAAEAPWAALNAARGDIFKVQQGSDGKLWVQEKLQASGYCAIRVVLASDSPLGPLDAGTKAILEKFAAVSVTGSGMFGLTVIDVPPDADLYVVRQLRDTGHQLGWWDYDELWVTDAWNAAT